MLTPSDASLMKSDAGGDEPTSWHYWHRAVGRGWRRGEGRLGRGETGEARGGRGAEEAGVATVTRQRPLTDDGCRNGRLRADHKVVTLVGTPLTR